MESKTSHSRYVLTLLAVIFVSTAFILMALDALKPDKRRSSAWQESKTSTRQAYLDGYLAARKKYQALCPLASLAVRQFTGTVQSVSGDTLTVLQQSLETDPLVDGVEDLRTVTITSATALQRVDAKPLNQIEQELAASRTSKQITPPPSLYSFISVKLAEIRVGQRVSVEAATDVRLQSNIQAVTIRLIK